MSFAADHTVGMDFRLGSFRGWPPMRQIRTSPPVAFFSTSFTAEDFRGMSGYSGRNLHVPSHLDLGAKEFKILTVGADLVTTKAISTMSFTTNLSALWASYV